MNRSAQQLIMGAILLFAGCRQVLEEGLEQREANEVVALLSQSGISAEKYSQGNQANQWAVRINKEDLASAWRELRNAGLPRSKHEGFRQVYKERGLVPGRLEEQAVYLSALQEELAQTLESIDGVASARVHVTLGLDHRLGQVDPDPPMASVLINYRTNISSQPPVGQDEIRSLVSHAVKGLAQDRVTVVYSAVRQDKAIRLSDETSAEDWSIWRLVLSVTAGVGMLVAVGIYWRYRRSSNPLRATGGRHELQRVYAARSTNV